MPESRGSMAQRERLDEIRQTIKKEKQVSVSVLSKYYGVTEETIRRDLDKLKEEGLISRTYGGAVLNVDNVTETVDYMRRAQTNMEEKARIGAISASVLPYKGSIGADASTTVMEAINAIGNRQEITVVTNSVRALFNADQYDLHILSTGGMVNGKTFSMQGIKSREALRDYHMDIVLISCKAMSLDGGVFDSNEEEAQWKKVLVERGQKIILLADHSKFDKVAFVKVTDLRNVDMVITDEEPSEKWKELFRKNNVQLVYEL